MTWTMPPPPHRLPTVSATSPRTDDLLSLVTARHQEFLTLMTEAQSHFLAAHQHVAAHQPVTAQAPGVRSLVFVVSTGRCGSTAMSNILNAHPDILSLSEFFLTVRTTLPAEGLVPAEEFWHTLADPHPLFNAMVRGGAGLPEFLYPDLAGARFTANTGIPAISLTSLPHLTNTPDDLFDALAAEVPTWPAQSARDHYLRLFGWFAARFGGTVVVERSGMSLGCVPWLRQCFPDARFVHLHRNGPDTAVSMSRHTGFRMQLLVSDTLELLDRQADRLNTFALPVDLASALGDRIDRDHLMGLDLPVTRFAQLWSDLIEHGTRELAGTQHLALSYEDLLATPEPTLRELAAFLDVDADENWMRHSAASLDGTRAGAAERLPEFEALKQICAPMTDQLRMR